MARLAFRSLQRRQRETFGFAVGDLVDHTLGDEHAGLNGRVMAVVNYGRVIAVQWADGTIASHAAHYLIPHVEGA